MSGNELRNFDKNQSANSLDVAVIGIACRLPGARNYEEYWENVKQGKSSIQEIPKDRWDWREFWGDPRNEENKTDSKWGGFIDDVDAFDPSFFGISATEAETMDPQQRIMLELSWSCMEDAGICPSKVSGRKVGVYIGVFNFDYKELQEKNSRTIETYYSTGTAAAVVANRISHCFNLKGPSLALDGSCSSSLNAIHLAAQSLHSGECSMALAGGISLLLTPTRHISFARTGMLSPTGSSKSFDEAADGYVRSEAAGILLLKPLKQAVEEGDLIYGIIKGSAMNHTGKTHTLTYPNPEAQAEVIVDAFTKAGIEPEEVNYIEAHGTGTPKGDPLEFQGLLKAFTTMAKKGDRTLPNNFCGLGSAKSNIGHAESAAGVAGVIKVLMSMKHKQLPGLQNFNKLNHRITLDESPFYIVDSLQEWKPLIGENLEPLPRRAGVSSFGFGGTNAHVLIEEAPDKASEYPKTKKERPCYLICLTAKTDGALVRKMEQFSNWLDTKGKEFQLDDISSTLLRNREHFRIRAAFVVQNKQELQNRIMEVLRNGDTKHYFKEVVSKNTKFTQVLFEELSKNILKELGSDVIKEKEYVDKLLGLAELYVNGYDLEWESLFSEENIRVQLPTYPFAQERYWIPELHTKKTAKPKNRDILHPLLHKNTSDFFEQRFSSVFTGEEFFLADHVVKHQRVLPGVAYLEMAREAVERSVGKEIDEKIRIAMKNVVWTRPVVVSDKDVSIHVALTPEHDEKFGYNIYSQPEGAHSDPVVHSYGGIQFIQADEPQMIDLDAIQVHCSEGILTSQMCYEYLRSMELQYGSAHQAIESIFVGGEQALAKLSLPAVISATQDCFVLHPSLMDAALQVSICFHAVEEGTLDLGNNRNLKPSLPFALQELEVMKPCTPDMWAFVRYSDGGHAKDKAQKLDIDLCDEQGVVCVRMKGFSSRVLEGEFFSSHQEGEAASSKTSEEPLIGLTTLVPVWDAVSLEKGQEGLSSTDRVVIVGGTQDNHMLLQQSYPHVQIAELRIEDSIDEMAQTLKAYGRIDHVVWIAPCHSLDSLQEDDLIKEQNAGVMQAFQTIKALLQLGYGTKKLSWSVITVQTQPIHYNDSINPTHASLHGLIGSMAKEYPNWHIRLLDVEEGCDWPLTDMFTLPVDAEGNAWVYRNEEWYRQKLIPAQGTKQEQTKYRHGGIYVVIGGTGGIGEVWSEYMIRTYQAQIIWIGRREKDASLQDKIDRLASLGPEPFYIAADAKDRVALERAYKEIKERFTHIHGVIHSAIVLLDQSLERMDEERFYAGLSAKVDVSVRMAQVFGAESLDFVLFFSSMNSFSKPAGQSNYVAGCTFKDAFAHQLAREWPCQVKVMNWGYWGSVGIVASDTYKKRMAQAGIGSIEPAEAMEALEALLSGGFNQTLVMKTMKPVSLIGTTQDELIEIYPESIQSTIQNLKNRKLSHNKENQAFSKSTESTTQEITETDLLLKKVQTVVIKLACNILQVDKEEIDLEAELNEYGFDPIYVSELTDTMNREYGLDLKSIELFDLPTLSHIAKYLRDKYEAVFANRELLIVMNRQN
ncbi:SDR family NAD(P)-dependent oxidoreductase [Brevibacillus laterosporus]|uniref:SDR family NAD(P)-dependent oxidoreductase n=2 Tax=Brevibacillus laterosporus TaxID=1465 RepID=A0AAP3G959_BRELA|nr:SDR family NAD(P)-dependent oxidoreductase [Brevibacillus laterosporus]MCR8978422.1 SDR family NAD(P)-dependent oxidoreductase [Brevibacillus laterosporus]MCZ0805577.1 SDR family NAD(P)-dependent oxidoreductase [Brevibacillus laterosporus]MCZ0825299.1 SDR family NAD(P)-dependent oxidoreductase [Brevibacillus laterosporus]MCZ0849075.1 SDR family NAD(P)-dependent oxidoreductase [Brevibacillus laterosporus]